LALLVPSNGVVMDAVLRLVLTVVARVAGALLSPNRNRRSSSRSFEMLGNLSPRATLPISTVAKAYYARHRFDGAAARAGILRNLSSAVQFRLNDNRGRQGRQVPLLVITIMSPVLEHNLDKAGGNLGTEEREAVQADHILGTFEQVLFAFCTTDNGRRRGVANDEELGKILFTNQRIIFYCRSERLRPCAKMYPYSALVSTSIPLTTAQGEDDEEFARLKLRDVDGYPHSPSSKYLWIYVKMTRAKDIRDLSEATASTDRNTMFRNLGL
jgi:hypothetical protein